MARTQTSQMISTDDPTRAFWGTYPRKELEYVTAVLRLAELLIENPVGLHHIAAIWEASRPGQRLGLCGWSKCECPDCQATN